jgi:hypothetical protein
MMSAWRAILQVIVVEAEAHAVGFRDIHRDDALALVGLRRVDHLDGLAAERPAQDRVVTGTQCRLVDVEFVRIDRTLDHGLAEAPRCRDEHYVTEAGVGVEREHDAARAEVAPHHVLDAGGERDQRMVEALVHSIGDRPVVEQRRKDLVHGTHHVRGAADVEQRLLLAREGRLRQVLGRCRRPDGHRNVATAIAHREIAFDDLPLQGGRKRRREDPVADTGAGRGEAGDVVHVQSVEFSLDPTGKALVGEEPAVGVGGRGEAARHGDVERGELGDHLAERGVLAADRRDVVAAEFGKRNGAAAHESPLASCIVQVENCG